MRTFWWLPAAQLCRTIWRANLVITPPHRTINQRQTATKQTSPERNGSAGGRTIKIWWRVAYEQDTSEPKTEGPSIETLHFISEMWQRWTGRMELAMEANLSGWGKHLQNGINSSYSFCFQLPADWSHAFPLPKDNDPLIVNRKVNILR